MTRDKFIFPSAITRILHHFSVSYPKSPHFSAMCAISVATIRGSEARLRSKQLRTETATPPASFAPSTFAPSTSASGVTLKAVMVQLQRMDARLDTLTTELYQVNTHVACIARRQAHLGGFVESPFPSLEASKDEEDDGDFDGDDANEDDASSSSGDEEKTASQ